MMITSGWTTQVKQAVPVHKGEQMVNEVTLVGYIGQTKKVSEKFFTAGLATSEGTKNKDTGEWDSKTTWHNLTLFTEYGARFYGNVHKGDLIYVKGKIQYTEKDEKRYTNIIVSYYRKLKKGEEQEVGGATEEPAAKPFDKPEVADETLDDGELF